ncbi:MAG TPA: precorrin-4 C(11)-methyltransferase, partial [Sulfitobacter sp.]|nr:precorrin-4 C(11)-methyltransferase [Sulfitobacter sp.]
AAAELGAELTLPGVAQSVILTRTSGRATAMPEGETLANFARTGATLAIHLSVHVLDKVVEDLTPHYGADCPVAVVWRASWPDQRIVKATLSTLRTEVGEEIARTALILVGRALGAEDFGESRLYAADYDRRFRPVGAEPRFPETSS